MDIITNQCSLTLYPICLWGRTRSYFRKGCFFPFICFMFCLFVSANKCYHFWDFLRDLLNQEIYETSHCVEWINRASGEFKITNTKELSILWGKCKNSKNTMNYDKLSRTIRYYIHLNILKKVQGKRLHFQFSEGKMWRKCQW